MGNSASQGLKEGCCLCRGDLLEGNEHKLECGHLVCGECIEAREAHKIVVQMHNEFVEKQNGGVYSPEDGKTNRKVEMEEVCPKCTVEMKIKVKKKKEEILKISEELVEKEEKDVVFDDLETEMIRELTDMFGEMHGMLDRMEERVLREMDEALGECEEVFEIRKMVRAVMREQCQMLMMNCDVPSTCLCGIVRYEMVRILTLHPNSDMEVECNLFPALDNVEDSLRMPIFDHFIEYHTLRDVPEEKRLRNIARTCFHCDSYDTHYNATRSKQGVIPATARIGYLAVHTKDPEVKVSLARMWANSEDNRIFIRNPDRFYKWYIAAAESGDPKIISSMRRNFDIAGVPLPIEVEVKYLDKVAKSGDPEISCRLGELFLKGEGVDKNVKKGVKRLEFAFNNGVEDAATILARELENNDAPEYREKWIFYVQKAAECGSAWFQKVLGDCYRFGVEIPPNRELAMDWYNKAADKQCKEAFFDVGDMLFEDGKYEEALKWLTDAQKAKNPCADHRVGECYLRGFGVEKDVEEARILLLRASNDGCPHAAVTLGKCYYDGEGVEQNFEEACLWFQQCRNKDAMSAHCLAKCTLKGQGVAKDEQAANALFRQAVSLWSEKAEEDNALAQYMLGKAYMKGRGVDVDYFEAKKWFMRAKQGNFNNPKLEEYISEATKEIKEAQRGKLFESIDL